MSDLVESKEKKASVAQRLEHVQSRLRARLSKINEERLLIENNRQSVATEVKSKAEQLDQEWAERERQAELDAKPARPAAPWREQREVPEDDREEQLQKQLESMIASKLRNLDRLQARATSSLSALNKLEEELCHGRSRLSPSEIEKRLAAQVASLDLSGISQGWVVANFRMKARDRIWGLWGEVLDRLPMDGIVFKPGCVKWKSLDECYEADVQMATLGAEEWEDGDEIPADRYQRFYSFTQDYRDGFCDVATYRGVKYAVRVRRRFEEGWGPFSGVIVRSFDTPTVERIIFDNMAGMVSWSPVQGASEYRVQLAGPFEEAKRVVRDEEYRHLCRGAHMRCLLKSREGFGYYYIRAQAFFPGPKRANGWWGCFSSPASFCYEFRDIFQSKKIEHRDHLRSCVPSFPQELVNLVGSYVPDLLEWRASSSTHKDCTGLSRIAVAFDETSQQISTAPLSSSPSPSLAARSSASSASPSSYAGATSFNVCVDQSEEGGVISIGVCESPFVPRPLTEPIVEYFYYDHGPIVGRQGKVLRQGVAYGVDDIISVRLDIGNKTLSFFKNGALQVQPIENIDASKPLHACVIMDNAISRVRLVE